MEKLDAVEKFIYLVKQIPDDRIEEIVERLEDYCEELGIITIVPFDRSRARPEFLKDLDEAIESSKRGEVISHEEVRREIFGE